RRHRGRRAHRVRGIRRVTASSAPPDTGMARRGQIPFRLRVGVTGHRTLDRGEGSEEAAAARVTQAVGEVMARIRTWLGVATGEPLEVRVVSSLAEGADRVVSGAILRGEG